MRLLLSLSSAAFAALLPLAALGHGDVAPQPVNTDSLPDIGEEWLLENPYREMGDEVMREAIAVGDSGYNQNCARCHGLGAVSGGLAPDLRYLSADWDGDEWWVERYRNGYTQNGITKMPAFEELLGQKAAWAIRSYVESRPDEDSMAENADELQRLRDEVGAAHEAAEADGIDSVQEAMAALQSELSDMAGQIESASGSPFADSAPLRAAAALEKALAAEAPETALASLLNAYEIMQIGTSSAR